MIKLKRRRPKASPYPQGSYFNNPAIIQAYQTLAQVRGQAGVGLSNNVRPNGSAFGDSKVQKALEGLQGMQVEQQGVGLSNNVRPNGSSLLNI